MGPPSSTAEARCWVQQHPGTVVQLHFALHILLVSMLPRFRFLPKKLAQPQRHMSKRMMRILLSRTQNTNDRPTTPHTISDNRSSPQK